MSKKKRHTGRMLRQMMTLIVVETGTAVVLLWFINTILRNAFQQLPIDMGSVNFILVILMVSVIVIDLIRSLIQINQDNHKHRKKHLK